MAIQISGNTVINDQRELGAALTSAYDVVTAAGTATIANRTVYYVTSNSQTITLPASPSVGNEVVIMVGNYTGVIVARPTSLDRIMGLTENMTLDKPYAAMTFIYVDATRGWVVC
jgi:hypothetical protein